VEDVFAVSCSGSTELHQSEPRQSSELKATGDIKEFCEKLAIKDDVAKTLSLARQYFTVLGDPRYEIVEDFECQELYLAIHVSVSGGPEEAVGESDRFLDAFVMAIEPGKQRRISLVYHSASV
jgi:hypothetical protein